MKLLLILALSTYVYCNPIAVEPVNPAVVEDGVPKVVDQVPLANSVQSVPVSSPVDPLVVPQASPAVPSVVNPAPAVASVVSSVAQQVAAIASQSVPSTYSKEPVVVAPNVVPQNVEQPKQIIPDSVSAFPSSVASSVQTQVSGFQSQAQAIGGQVMTQMQDQVSSVQSQVSAFPGAVSDMVPSGIIPSLGAAKAPEPVVSPNVPVVASNAPIVPSNVPVVSSNDQVVPQAAPVAVDSVSVEDKNSVEQVALTGSIDKATKMVMDVEQHLKTYLPAEEELLTTLAPQVYSGDVAETEGERQQNQMATLIDQVNRLADSIEKTINSLVAERRYITAAMLRSMLNYVRRVRLNLERLQNRLQSVQSVATTGQNAPGSSGAAAGVPGTAFFNSVRDRINRMTEEIGSLVTRIRSSLNPGSSVTVAASSTTTQMPLVTAANLENIGPASSVASGSIVSAISTINAQPQNVAATVVAAQAA